MRLAPIASASRAQQLLADVRVKEKHTAKEAKRARKEARQARKEARQAKKAVNGKKRKRQDEHKRGLKKKRKVSVRRR